MAFTSANVSIGTSGGTVCAAPATNDLLEYKIQNFGGNLLYLGSTAGTSALLASGYPVPTTTSQIFVLEQGDVVYGLASTGTCDVRVLTAVLTRKQLRRL